MPKTQSPNKRLKQDLRLLQAQLDEVVRVLGGVVYVVQEIAGHIGFELPAEEKEKRDTKAGHENATSEEGGDTNQPSEVSQ